MAKVATLILVFLATLTTLILIVHCKHLHKNYKKQGEQCNTDQIYLKAHVRVPGCYPKVHLQKKCVNSRQCIDENTFCGIVELTTNITDSVCLCKEGTKEECGQCVVWHKCSISHFNREYLQADCPHSAMYCTANRCLCRPGFMFSQLADDCVVEEKEDEEEEVTTKAEVDKGGQKLEKDKKDNCPNLLPNKHHSYNPQVPLSLAIIFIIILFIAVLPLTYILLKKICYGKYSKVSTSAVVVTA